MQRRRGMDPMPVPATFRALVPVLAARGGAGRSVVAALIAYAFAPATATVVVDPQPRTCSPWPDWANADDEGGIAGLFAHGREPESYEIAHAALLRQVPVDSTPQDSPDDVSTYSLLTDHRPWDARPIPTPTDPAWFARVVDRGGWSVGVVDTGFPATAEHLRDRHRGRLSALAGWCRRTDAAPVVVAPATGAGLSGLLQLLTAVEADGLPASGVIAVLTGHCADPFPRRLRTRLDAVRARVAALARVPYDPALRVDGLAGIDRVAEDTRAAGLEIGRAIVAHLQANETPQATSGTAPTQAEPSPTPATPPDLEPAPAPFTAMSANTGWVPVRPRDGDDAS